MDKLGDRNRFQNSLKRERKPIAKAIIQSFLKPEAIKDISNEQDGIEEDKDYMALVDGKWRSIEVKHRDKRYWKHAFQDILIETRSSMEYDTFGWIEKSKAEYLLYIWHGETAHKAILCDLPSLKEWWRQNKEQGSEKMIGEYYTALRALVSDRFKIEIRDGRTPEIVLKPDNGDEFPWTRFFGMTLEDTFQRAIKKLNNPEEDYRDVPSLGNEEGHLWKADGHSYYSANHIRGFLKETEQK